MPNRDEPRPYPNAPVDLAWLAQHTETALEPELPIVDPHHHLWDKPGDRYLMEALLADLASGHDVRATVFLQCGFSFRPDGPAELRPVGETAAVAALAEAAASAVAGRPCAGIVGYADLRLGDRVAAVLEAHREAGRAGSRASARAARTILRSSPR